MSQVGLHAPDEARPPWQYRGTIDAAKKMYRSEGLRVFYSGLGPALLGLSHVAIQFPMYEFLKMQFTGLEMGENTTDHQDNHYFIGISTATFLSKVCATCATYPHEVLRTRLQTQQRTLPTSSHDEMSFRGGLGHLNRSRGPGTASSDGMINIPRYKGMVKTIRTIITEEGWRAFYNGMGTNLIRAVPAAMTTMLTYESLKTVMHRLQIEGEMVDEVYR
jgi:solute carrier family 25 folate transporter 32